MWEAYRPSPFRQRAAGQRRPDGRPEAARPAAIRVMLRFITAPKLRGMQKELVTLSLTNRPSWIRTSFSSRGAGTNLGQHG